jgi:predicted DCC family thiol-disulfide oxidoreductase YuxK
MKKHLVFYDGHCGLCDRVVQFLLKVDKDKQFVFAPLQGETAKILLLALPSSYKSEDSLILMENYNSSNPQFYVLGKGALRVCWLLGGPWALIGVLNFLPSFLYNWIYRIVARNRHKLFKSVCVLPDPSLKDRFLT